MEKIRSRSLRQPTAIAAVIYDSRTSKAQNTSYPSLGVSEAETSTERPV